MKKIGLRELNRNMYSHIKTAPFIVTKNHEPYLIVLPYNKALESYAGVSGSKTLAVELPEDTQFSRTTYPPLDNNPSFEQKPVETWGQFTNKDGQPNKTFWRKVRDALKRPLF